MHVFIKNASNHLDHMRPYHERLGWSRDDLFNLKSCDWHSNFIQSTFGERKYSPPKFSHHLEKFRGCYFTLKCTLLLLNIIRAPCRLFVESKMSNQTSNIFTTVYNDIKIDISRGQVWYRGYCALGRWQIRIGFELDETFSFL